MRTLSIAGCLLALSACSPTVQPGTGGPGPGPGVDSGPIGPGPTPGVDSGVVTPPPTFDAGLMECAAVNVNAQTLTAPVDIVWVIDNSGSMRGEADIVQANLNNFANAISASGIDVHVVVITAPGYVTVPPPLGSNTEQYRAIGQSVSSHAALQQLVATYPMWSDFIREGSQLHIIAVTDDESDMNASAFMTQFGSLIGGRSYRFHSIVSPVGATHTVPIIGIPLPGCTGPNGDAADNGAQYSAVSTATMGREFSICTPDWSALFAELQSVIAVPMPLPCVFDIPDPPEGETLDPNRVNLTITRTGGFQQVVPNVQVFERCTGDGWYYDNPTAPTRIVLCPTTCMSSSADMGAAVSIALGCATQLL